MTVQNHIHLAATRSSSPEFSPVYTWKVRDRQIPIEFYVDVVSSLVGNRYDHAIEVDGDPVVYQDYYYEVKIMGDTVFTTEEYMEIFLSLAGRRLYLVDNIHPNDGSDHTDFVQQVRMVKMSDIPLEHWALQFFYVPILLKSLTPR